VNALIHELLRHAIRQVFTDEEWFGGALIGLGLWFLDHALIELRRRRWGYTTILALMVTPVVWVIVTTDWQRASLIKTGVFGIFVWLPLHVATTRGRKRKGPFDQTINR
jgi:hypothetical protein